MDPKTQQQIIEGLQAVAKKIGENADYLFRLSVRQQWINGVECFIWFGICSAATYGMFKLWKYCGKDNCVFDDPEFARILVGIGFFIPLIAALILLTNGIDLILNPEYWALHSILKMFQGSN